MRRGDVVAIADKSGDYTSKPRPAVVAQADAFTDLDSVTVCPITGEERGGLEIRVPVVSSGQLTLAKPSWIEIDKVTTVRRNRVGQVIGSISDGELAALDRAFVQFLGIGQKRRPT